MPLQRNLVVGSSGLLLCLVLMLLPDNLQQLITKQIRSTMWTNGQWVFSQVIRYARNEEKSRFLLTQNVELALENMQLREAKWENQRLRRALDFKRQETKWKIVAAEVIGRDPDHINDSIIINAGTDRGIGKDWPVVTAHGLVGHVLQADEYRSVVRLLVRTRVSALVQDQNRSQGIVVWLHGTLFRLAMVEVGTKISPGDRVISSGLGGRYPKGILIGFVVKVNEDAKDTVFKEVLLESNVDFHSLEEVFVVTPQLRKS